MKFEKGKCYKHTTGYQISIICEVDSTLFGKCLLGEDTNGSFVPVGSNESNAENFVEISREEWMNNFTVKD